MFRKLFLFTVLLMGLSLPIAAQPPSQLQLIAPTGTLTDTLGNPTFQWTDVGANGYQLYLARSSDLASSVFFRDNITSADCDGTACSLVLTDVSPGAFLTNDTYTVFLNTATGSVADWQGPFTFTIATPPPAAVTMTEPTNTDTPRPNIHWRLDGDAVNAIYFRVYLAPSADITNSVLFRWYSRESACGTLQDVLCAIAPDEDLMNATPYTVYVQAYGPGGFSTTGGVADSGWSEAMFNVGGPTPAVPANVVADPGLGRVDITWDADPATLRYLVFITNPGGDYFVTHQSADICDVTTCTLSILPFDFEFATGSHTVYMRPESSGGPRGDGLLNLGWFEVATFAK